MFIFDLIFDGGGPSPRKIETASKVRESSSSRTIVCHERCIAFAMAASNTTSNEKKGKESSDHIHTLDVMPKTVQNTLDQEFARLYYSVSAIYCSICSFIQACCVSYICNSYYYYFRNSCIFSSNCFFAVVVVAGVVICLLCFLFGSFSVFCMFCAILHAFQLVLLLECFSLSLFLSQ